MGLTVLVFFLIFSLYVYASAIIIIAICILFSALDDVQLSRLFNDKNFGVHIKRLYIIAGVHNRRRSVQLSMLRVLTLNEICAWVA